jgi:hypothetical protein
MKHGKAGGGGPVDQERRMKTFRNVLQVLVLVGVACLLRGSSALAQGAAVWTNLGLYGGQIYDIAIDPVNPGKMFAGSYLGDGLYVSTDGGGSWNGVKTADRLAGEDSFKDHAVWSVEIAPSDNKVVWATHNYWAEKSTDGGLTWTHIYNNEMQRDCPNCGGEGDNFRFCRSLVVDPANPNTVYVGAGGKYASHSAGAVYKTQDGGLTWAKTGFNASNEFDYDVVDIDIDPLNHNVIWLVTSSSGYGTCTGGWCGTLYRSLDGGGTWEVALNLGTYGGAYLTVAAKPGDPTTAFTGSGFGIIKHWYANGWHFLLPCSESGSVQSISFDPHDSNQVYAVWLKPISWGGDGIGKVGRSLDGGDTWLQEDIYSHSYNFLSITVHPTNGEIVLAGDVAQGVYKSEDHGQTWTAVNNGINSVIVYDVAADSSDSTHFLAGTLSGTYEKKGEGAWSRLMPYATRSVKYDPINTQTYYAGILGYLAKTTDGGSTWRYSNYLGYRDVEDVAVDPTNTNTVYVAAHRGNDYGKILKSVDGGATLFEVLSGQNQLGENHDFNAVVVDPSDHHHILAGGGNFYAPKVLGDLWESNDGGANWVRTSLQSVIVNALLISSEQPNIVYAGCGYSGGAEVPLYKSSDGGNTWTASYQGIPDMRDSLKGGWGTSGTDVFAVGLGGTILHYGGSAWSAMSSGTTNPLYGVWGVSGTDVFAVGATGTILHYDGSAWSAMTNGTTESLYGVWGVSGTDVFAVGWDGTIQHYDGSAWSAMSSGTSGDLSSVWGTSGTDVFAVGSSGAILHYDGSAWSTMSSGTSEDLSSVWGTSGTDVFAVGLGGAILHYDGSAWSAMSSGTSEDLLSVWGISGTDVFAVGWSGTILHYNGIAWLSMSAGSTEALFSVWGTSVNDVFAFGGFGLVLHFDGSSWNEMRAGGSFQSAVTDLAFHRRNLEVVYASTFGAGVYVSPNQGGRWLNLGTPEHNVFAISTSSLYGATQGGLYQCTGTGVIAGDVTDSDSSAGIDRATVYTDLGLKTVSVNGVFMMVHPCGILTVTAVAEGHANMTAPNTVVLGGDVTMIDMPMPRGVAGPPPGEDGGGGGGGGGCFISASADGSWAASQFMTPETFLGIAPWTACAESALRYEADRLPFRMGTLSVFAIAVFSLCMLASRARRRKKDDSLKIVT